MKVSFSAYGTPKGQPRARAFRRGNHTGVYDPGTADAWKFSVREAARSVMGEVHFEGRPLRVSIDFYFPRPKKHFRKCGLRHDAPRWHTQKPDRDNLEKAVLDALTTLGIWEDDSQVCCGQVRKLWSESSTGLAVVTISDEME